MHEPPEHENTQLIPKTENIETQKPSKNNGRHKIGHITVRVSDAQTVPETLNLTPPNAQTRSEGHKRPNEPSTQVQFTMSSLNHSNVGKPTNQTFNDVARPDQLLRDTVWVARPRSHSACVAAAH